MGRSVHMRESHFAKHESQMERDNWLILAAMKVFLTIAYSKRNVQLFSFNRQCEYVHFKAVNLFHRRYALLKSWQLLHKNFKTTVGVPKTFAGARPSFRLRSVSSPTALT